VTVADYIPTPLVQMTGAALLYVTSSADFSCNIIGVSDLISIWLAAGGYHK